MNSSLSTKMMIAAALAASSLLSPMAHAQAWPTKPVKLVQGFAPGGNGDIISRLLAQKISEPLGQTVIVEGRTGSGGNVAADFVAKSPADGYTIILLTGGHAVSAAMYRQLPFDPFEDFSMISLAAEFAFVVGTQHLAGEFFKSVAGIDIIHIPYRGGGAPVTDVMAGRVSMLFDTFTPTLPHIKSGKLRALGVTSKTRAAALPELVPVADTLPAYEVTSWVGIAAPAKLPGAILDRFNQELVRAIAAADVRERLTGLTTIPRSSTPAEMRSHVASEIAKWKRVVEVAKIERQ